MKGKKKNLLHLTDRDSKQKQERHPPHTSKKGRGRSGGRLSERILWPKKNGKLFKRGGSRPAEKGKISPEGGSSKVEKSASTVREKE